MITGELPPGYTRQDAREAGLTRAGLLGAPVQEVRPLHIVVPPGSYRPRQRGLSVHVRDIGADDEIGHRGLALTSGAQTWLDLAVTTPPDELVAIGDALCRADHLCADLGYSRWKIAVEYEGRQHAELRQFDLGHRPVHAHGRQRLARAPLRPATPRPPHARGRSAGRCPAQPRRELVTAE